MITRRTLLGIILAGAWRSQGPLGDDERDALDEALEMLAPYAASFSGGLSNHGPMAAEALVALGRPDAVVPWIEHYVKRLEARPSTHERIEAAAWRDALGDHSRSGDWSALFANELAEAPWREVVGLWVPRLAPGIAAAGTHAAIRAGHAVCSLEVVENAARLDELAEALAYWAADFLALPGTPWDGGTLAPSRAIESIELVPKEKRTGGGLITREMKALLTFEPFEHVIELVDPAAGEPDFMADLLATFAGIYLNTKNSSFVFLHAVTGAASIRELLPYVAKEHRANVFAYTWQVTAGIVARYARPGLVGDFEVEKSTGTPEELADRAVESGDEHTIKLTAACIREWRRNPDPRLLAAAEKRIG